MEGLDSNAWVFDSLVGFLHGPVWNVPLQTFIEEKSLPFEPSDDGEVLDKPEYAKIHVEYRNLVDVMLGSFMDDIGITADQFEAACRLSAGELAGLPSSFHRRLFEQVWAANDYSVFVKMMTHKNMELQLQALELIEQRFGAMPSLFSPDQEDLDTSKSDESFDWPDNDDVMTEIKNQQHTERLLQSIDYTQSHLAYRTPSTGVRSARLLLCAQIRCITISEREGKIRKARLQLDDFENTDKSIDVLPEKMAVEKHTLLSKLHTFEMKEQEKLKSPPVELQSSSQPKPALHKIEVSEEEVRARQEYLKQQRDKLLALKKQVRERKLDAAENEDASGGGECSRRDSTRPRSARVAQAVLKGSAPPPPSDAMQLRRALASKLKTEVVESSH